MGLLRRVVLIQGCALLLCLCSLPAAWAIMPPKGAKDDAKRFGLDQLSPPRRISPRRISAQALGGSAPLSRDILGVDPATLVVERESHGNGHSHVLYRQTYKGLPVEFARVKVHLDDSGKVLGVNSSAVPDINLDISPRLSASLAAEAVRRDSGAAPSDAGTLVVLPDQKTGEPRLAWRFTAGGGARRWKYYADANTGDILFRYDELHYLQQSPDCVALTSGVVSGLVFDIDPVKTPGPVARRFNNQNVYVVNGTTFATTGGDSVFGQGFFCSQSKGKIFTQLQGPYVNVANFRGPSAHYDNGNGVWHTLSTVVSSPHPYPDNYDNTATIDISVQAPTAVKFLPVFSSFNVGTVLKGSFGESLDITTDDQVQIIDSNGNQVAAFVGNRGAFNATAVPGTRMGIRLVSSGGTNVGYDVSLSSYLTLTNPTEYAVNDSSLTWDPALHTSIGQRMEIDLFYHLNRMHDFFMADVNKSSAAFIGKPVVAMAYFGPSLFNAFYDSTLDKLFFGDVSSDAPADWFGDDATVSHHEYVHFVVEKIWSIQNFGQAGAISEATADYFSASSLNDPDIGSFIIGAIGGSGPLRELDCRAHPPCKVLSNSTWVGEIHDDSQFLSQALWDIRSDLVALKPAVVRGDPVTGLQVTQGQSCMDGLVFQALQFFPESFQEFLDAIKRVDAMGSVAACGGAGTAQAIIGADFAAHGLPPAVSSNETFTKNNGFESAVDISTLGTVSGTIFPASDADFFTFGAGPGPIAITLTLPPDGHFFKGYFLTLYDRSHNTVATASPPYDGVNTNSGLCTDQDCTTTQSRVVLQYNNPSGNQFYVQVAGGPTFDGLSNSGVNSTLPYSLSVNFIPPGALSGAVAAKVFDKDTISFTVNVTTFVQVQDYSLAYAQLRDHSLKAVPNTLTHVPAAAGDFLTMLSSANALGRITGQVQLVPGFAKRFPSIGTVYLEVFAYNVIGSTVSLGLSNALNLTTNQSEVHAWNNVFNPLKGGKTTVKYDLQNPGRITMKLYTLSGSYIATLLNADVPTGKGSVDWNGTNVAGSIVASGIYLLHVEAPGISETRKIAVVK